MNETPVNDVTAVAQEPLADAASEATEVAQETSAVPEGEGALNPPVKPKKDGLEKRVQELLSDRKLIQERERLAREENRRLLDLLNSQKPTEQKTQPTSDDPIPDLKDFSDYDAYVAAKAAWAARAEYKRIRTEEQAAEQARNFATKQQQESQARDEYTRNISVSWDKLAMRGENKFPDFSEKVHTIPDSLLPPAVVEAIATSSVGDEVAYYLGTHREIAKSIAAMSPIDQVREITRLELRAAKPSSAPTPVTPVNGGSAINDAPSEKDSFAEWERKRLAQKRKRK